VVHAFAEYDAAGDDKRINGLLEANNLTPAIVVTTGTVPHARRHLYFKLDGAVTPDQLKAANAALKALLGSDDIQNPDRVLRLAGTVSYPSPDKQERGYVAELVTLQTRPTAPAYKIDALIGLGGGGGESNNNFTKHGKTTSLFKFAHEDSEIEDLLKASQVKNWHNNMLKAIASMIGRGWTDFQIRMVCAPYCTGGAGDPDLAPMIDDGREKFNKPEVEIPVEGDESDVDRLNKVHAVLPIGDKTRVVTFGELEEFPGLETIVMTQTLGDFAALQNKYRHAYHDDKGVLKYKPLGSHWIGSAERRQYDGGMAFMPGRDGDFGNKLNLWRGFGVTPTKPEPGSRAEAGCQKFLAFMRDIICSGNEVDFSYLLRREATMFQKRKRTEVAIGLRTKEEGCGKGFYEQVIKRLLGSHAMQVTNPKHVIGAFNPHQQTLLRLIADEALFVGNHEHRNALFAMVTEPKLTIEPKGLGVYQVNNFLNISMLSNADHFLPVSDSARRFFVPIVSAARKRDTQYFGDLESDLEAGGYEALLYYFLHEVDLSNFNVRQVPQSEGLLEQRDQSLEPLHTWWTELLESGVLTGADPSNPRCAISHEYDRKVEWQVISGGVTNTHIRHVKQKGFLDQARIIEPKLRNVSDHKIGKFLRDGGCRTVRVLRHRGWEFPSLLKCRADWEAKYPHWTWENSDITAWSAEDGGDATSPDADPARHSDWKEGQPFPKDLRG
jgi:hypothetical protein